jgi:SAM-dependent methyltransferase
LLLDLGCGTGNHDLFFAKKGFQVTGIDFSQQMIKIARKNLSHQKGLSCDFRVGDIRKLRLTMKFDTVVSLFHVMSYQTTNTDLREAFTTASFHLDPGGIFIFDCWYGPGVLTDRPTIREKQFHDEEFSFKRIAEPVMHPDENVVDVNYTIHVKDRQGNSEEIHETHRMRYLFRPEIEYFSKSTGFEIMDFREFLTGKDPGFGTWNACIVLKKNQNHFE